MCGIAGKVAINGPGPAPELLTRMTQAIRHRGPDDGGVWADGRAGLGSRRLAVLDLSERGHQPFVSADGRYHLVYNGEIYNYRMLRRDLEAEGQVFHTGTDTEVLLRLFEVEGAACLQRLRGMFAFAVWDAREQRLFAARDRLGKKPFYYALSDRALTFGSEPAALLQDPDVCTEPDPEAIDHFLSFGYVPDGLAAFRGMRKLPPAHWLTFQNGDLRVDRYWDVSYAIQPPMPETAALEALAAQLDEAVAMRLVSDVPLGALLSGGIDSSAVVACMRRHVTGPLRTFSIGFEDPRYDELTFARSVAERFETEHTEMVVRPAALPMLERLVEAYGEPFADSSAIPSLAVSELARQSVTVALTGDGGDETLLGYDRYRALALASRVPSALRGSVGAVLRRLPAGGSVKSPVARARRFGASLSAPPVERYIGWTACFSGADKQRLYTPDFQAACGADPFNLIRTAFAATDAPSIAETAADADLHTYLPGDLLVKADIASMAHSLELRSPFLDHVFVEFAATLPASFKLRNGVSKYLLRKLVEPLLPAAVVTRPKMGFGVPIERWLREELKEILQDVLLSRRAIDRGYFQQDQVERLVREHLSGSVNHHFRLWALLVLELWHRRHVDPPLGA